MLRSMYTGISGMRGFQSKLDVVSNNIANVNTFGYKKGRLTFSDLMSQTMQGATGPVQNAAGDTVLGGRNPKQVGLGTATGSIDNIHTQGNRQTTNRPLDLAIEGDGMFIVAERSWTATNAFDPDTGDDEISDIAGSSDDVDISGFNTTELDDLKEKYISLENDNISFTRAGNFYLDDDGYVVNSSGQYLVGSSQVDGEDFTSKIQIPEGAQSFSIAADGTVNFVDQNGQAQIAGQLKLASFSNQEGLEKAGGNLYKLTDNAGVVVDNPGNGMVGLNDIYTPGQDGTGSLFAGSLEMSNVDLAEEFTEMITAQRGFQANTRVITTSDEILQELVNLKR